MSTRPPAPPDFIPDDEMPDFISDEDAATFGLERATSIGPTPWYQRHPEIAGVELPSAEGVAEGIPAIAATAAGALATRHPGVAATLGGVAGEAARQLFRRAVGAPAATGVAQRALGADPDSPTAAAAGLAGETAAGLVGAGASRAMRGLAGGAERSAERSIVRDILGGARTEREVAEAPALARRAQAAGIVRSLTKRSRVSRAEAALDKASGVAARETSKARATGAGVEAGPVIEDIANTLPSTIPGSGGVPRRAASAERRAATKVLEDEFDAIANTGGGATGSEIPLDITLKEIDALDAQLKPMYDRGALDPALGKKATQAARKAFAGQLREAFPELADARLAKHELLTIRDMAQRVVDEEMTRSGSGHQLAGAAGAAAVGRYGPAGASIFSSLARTTAPLSIPARQIAAKILRGGARTAQLWMRAADMIPDDEIRKAERNRKAQAALRTQAEGVVAP